MPQYFFPHHVHLCLTEDAAVFLDLKRDKYLGLSFEKIPALHAALTGTDAPDGEAAELVKMLFDEGLLTKARELGRAARLEQMESSKSVLIDMDIDGRSGFQASIRVHHVVNFLLAYARALINFKFGSLNRATCRVRRIKQRNSGVPMDLNAAQDLVRIFQRIRPLLYTAHDHCVLDSLTMIEFLARYNIFPTWMLGVRTKPFAAHAWVQYGDFVFSDSPARTRAHTPIMSV